MHCPYKPNVRVVVHIVYHYSQKGSEMRVVVQIKDHHSHLEGVLAVRRWFTGIQAKDSWNDS